MKTIYKPDDGPITISDAKKLIYEALPDGTAAEVWMHVDGDGNPVWDGPMELKEVPEANLYDLDGVILDMHQQGQITPRFRFRPTQTNYTGKSADLYEIGHSEFVAMAQMFSCRVTVGNAPSTEIESSKLGTAKRWTPEFRAQVKAYRETHTEKETADKFDVSGSRIRQKLAEDKTKTKPKASLFPTTTHRIK